LLRNITYTQQLQVLQLQNAQKERQNWSPSFAHPFYFPENCDTDINLSFATYVVAKKFAMASSLIPGWRIAKI